jgi:hypothetical protein
MTRDRRREGGDKLSVAERYPRPAAVELAAAILIIGGIIGLIGAIGGMAALPPGTEAITALTITLDIASIVVGVLVRMGRLWIVDVNYVAVLGFLDILAAAGSNLALLRGLGEIAVVVILILHRPWFVARSGSRDEEDEGSNGANP